MSPRARNALLVGAAALAAAGVVVGATLLTRSNPPGTTAAAKPQPGVPPLLIDLGVRTDREAVALRRALDLYRRRQRRAAAAVFGRYRSLEAEVGAALSAWPDGFDSLVQLARTHPRSGLARLELGLALFWQGRVGEAQVAWREAKRVQPDSPYAVHAADLLHPKDVPGLPFIVPTFPLPPALSRPPTAATLATLAARARYGGVHERIRYGLVLRGLGRPVSAERQFAAAAAAAPNDVDARVTAAVGLFDKDRPAVAFSRLGPLTRVFPKAVTVRFHLGLMLLWIHEVAAARTELRRVIAAGPSSYATSARELLANLPAK